MDELEKLKAIAAELPIEQVRALVAAAEEMQRINCQEVKQDDN